MKAASQPEVAPAADSLTIGQVARETGLGVETVRFYERRGLIEEPPRRESGYRQYPPDVLPRLGFIRRAKELGFSLAEIMELLSLRVDPDSTCADVRARTMTKITDIETKIGELERMRDALTDLHGACHGSGPTSECPILDYLDQPEA